MSIAIGLLDLPIELISEIAEYAPRNDLLTLCTVSRVVGELATRVLYRDIDLSTPNTTVRCCRTLVTNGVAARSVHFISIYLEDWECMTPNPTLFPAFFRLVRNALGRLKQVTRCLLRTVDTLGLDTILSISHFPHLLCFRTGQIDHSTLVPFLQRHPSLEELHVLSLVQGTLSDISAAPPASLNLPRLKWLAGTFPLIRLIRTETSICELTILRGTDDRDFDSLLSFIEHCTTHLQSLRVVSSFWDGETIYAIAKHLPDLNFICFVHPPHVDFATHDFVRCVGEVMPRFTSLISLTLPGVTSLYSPTIPQSVLDTEYKTVLDWTGRCSTLEVCSFPSCVKWTRIHNKIWIPSSELAIIAATGKRWLLEKVLLKHPAFVDFPKELRDPTLVLNGGTVATATKSMVAHLARTILDLQNDMQENPDHYQVDDTDEEDSEESEEEYTDDDEEEDSDEEDDNQDEDGDKDEDDNGALDGGGES
ncbi:hypothetical protein PLICRDRAFT_47860 [Plicaturopsis crispa FD-325 SS-3]|nr:hypothetical protein PLICRDRAFT_47860 [Plicaturopsis crispa FD-325 SS-3]